jgi:hypothetical protein
MEKYCSTSQSPQRAVAPTDEEEEEEEEEEEIHEIEMLRFERMRFSLFLYLSLFFLFQDKGHNSPKNGLRDFGNFCSFY